MNNQIKCKCCSKELDINEAMSKKSGGFECQSCSTKWGVLRFCLFMVVAVIVVAIQGNL